MDDSLPPDCLPLAPIHREDSLAGKAYRQLRAALMSGRLMPGQFARLSMGQPKPEPALLVSERAVGTDQNKKFVMVVDGQNHAEYREVTLGASVDGLRVVASGLKAGERIVVNGLQRVRPGVTIKPETVAMDAAANKTVAQN